MEKLVPFKENLCSKDAIKMLSIKINNACNRNCHFCVDRGGRNGKVTDVNKIATNALKYDEYKTVIITGGEPFLDFNSVCDLAEKLRNYKDRIVLNTNGTLLSKEKVNALNGLIDELQVSIHHYDENRHGNILGGNVSFENMKESLAEKQFMFSVNSTFNKEYTKEERPTAVAKMIELCKYLGADRLRLTELKKVSEEDFVYASEFFEENNAFVNRTSSDLITKGCTDYFEKDGILVSVKRLCEYAKGENAPAFSCCFINTSGQVKINVDTEDTFKVIYSDGLTTNDWIFDGIKKKTKVLS
jgi:MoaA/NifB/PqqE/SkfB family radical SAM enzyme